MNYFDEDESYFDEMDVFVVREYGGVFLSVFNDESYLDEMDVFVDMEYGIIFKKKVVFMVE